MTKWKKRMRSFGFARYMRLCLYADLRCRMTNKKSHVILNAVKDPLMRSNKKSG